jgi:hypothetical protein
LEFEGELDPTWSEQVIPVAPGTPRRRISTVYQLTPDPLEPVPPPTPTSYYLAESDDTIKMGQPIYIKASGHAGLAVATGAATAAVIGLAVSDAVPTHNIEYVTDTSLTLTDWSEVIGTESLTSGAIYFLALSIGKLVTPAPTSGYVVPVGRAASTNTLDIEIGQSVRL